MATTITCADGDNDFTCCAGTTTNDHDFKGVIIHDGTHEQRLINPIQLVRKASSVLVFDENGSYIDIAVADVAAASTVNELAALLVACRASTGGVIRETFTSVTTTITVSATIPNDTDNVVVFVGFLLAKETDHYTITGQNISFTENPEGETVQVFIFS